VDVSEPAASSPTLRIGPIAVDPPVVLAPMAGVTNPAYRALCRSYGPGLLVSEMVNARGIVEGSQRTRRLVAPEPGAPHHSVQLYGTDPAAVGAAVRILVDGHGVDHVDLNVGCPVPKVTRKGGGAALPVHGVLFGRIVEAAVQAGAGVPVTVKQRIGIDDEHHTFLAAGRIAAAAGVAAVALHARTASQLYSGRARWSAIAELKVALPDVPVLGNGDIWTAADALAMVAETGCDGVVVGRGCLGRPWLFRDLADAFAGRPPEPAPALGEVVAVMRDHAERLVEHLGEHEGVLSFRKHVAWYLLGLPVGRARRNAVTAATSWVALERSIDLLVDGLDAAMRPDPRVESSPRGTTRGPQRVTLPEQWYETADDPTPPLGADLLVSGG
jgi:nifR3 family TIM-barrel protein